MTIIDVFYGLILISFFANLFLLLINLKKINSEMPLLFKFIYYSIIYTFTVIMSIGIILIGKVEIPIIFIWVLLGITFVLFLIHYILDEDIGFRFNKGINFIIVFVLSIVLYFVWMIFIY